MQTPRRKPVHARGRWALITAMLLLAGCGGESGNDGSGGPDAATDTRPYYLGFTPWPYAATTNAVSDTYNRIQNHGDIVAHHLMDGIPWDAAYNETALPAGVESDISGRLGSTRDGQAIYLAVDAINGARNGLANDWTDAGSQPRSAPWDTRGFADPEVIAAYSNFALDMIERFDPAYFNYASEISELVLNDPDQFDDFVTFAQGVAANIRDDHPDLPLLVSVALKSPGSDEAGEIVAEFDRLLPYIDIVGISVYPYAFFGHASAGNPASLPDNWLSQIEALAGTKPVAITETGWIAEDLDIAGFGLSVDGSPARQSAYVETLLAEAEALEAEFIIWFSVVDYDTLWEDDLGMDDVAKIWKDTGLYDESLTARPALNAWDAALNLDRASP